MAIYRAQVSAAADSLLPRDRIVNTLHFEKTSPDFLLPADEQKLADDLRNIWTSNWYLPAGTREVKVTLYRVEGPPPHFPVATSISGTGLAPQSQVPREVALCLSFYADRNVPRQRGRIYLCCAARGLTSLQVRPPTSLMTDLLPFADALSGLGGVDINWSVYSPTDQRARKVTNAWVDDEWDTVRSRGLRATKREQRAQSG